MSGAETSARYSILGELASLEQSKPPFVSATVSSSHPLQFIASTLYPSQLLFAMATLQRVVISLLLIITAGFLFLAQTSSAAKGPLITNKVD